MRISDWSSDVCSSDLLQFAARHIAFLFVDMPALRSLDLEDDDVMIVIMRQKALRARRRDIGVDLRLEIELDLQPARERRDRADITFEPVEDDRSEEHTSELQSLMRISYAVFCLTKKKNIHNNTI